MIIDLLSRGVPILSSCLSCGNVGTARRKRFRAAFKPSRYLRSTALCGMRDIRASLWHLGTCVELAEGGARPLRDLPGRFGAAELGLSAVAAADILSHDKFCISSLSRPS